MHLDAFYDNLAESGIKKGNGKNIGNVGLAPKTILHHHRLISKILSSAVKWDIVEKNIATRATPPRIPHREMEYLNEDESKRMIALLQKEPVQNRTMIMLLILLGMRRGELLGLEWKDIDFANQTLRIVRTSQFVDKAIITKEPKTQSSIRTLSFDNVVLGLLQDFRAWQDGQRERFPDWKESDRLFTSPRGGPMHPDSITQWFSKFIKRSGLPKVSLHSLRHSNATLMIAGDVDIATVSKRLGHANTSVTLNIYTHALKSRDRLAAQTLESLLT